MRRAALLITLALVLAACGGSDDDAATTTISDTPDGEVTTTEVRSESPISGTATSGNLVEVIDDNGSGRGDRQMTAEAATHLGRPSGRVMAPELSLRDGGWVCNVVNNTMPGGQIQQLMGCR